MQGIISIIPIGWLNETGKGIHASPYLFKLQSEQMRTRLRCGNPVEADMSLGLFLWNDNGT